MDKPYFKVSACQIYPSELQLNKANGLDTETTFLFTSTYNGFVPSTIYDRRDDIGFDIENFLFLDGDVPGCTSY